MGRINTVDIFNEVKVTVPIIEACNNYGITIDRYNRALCPFHNEKTPSFKIYKDSNSFYCFGCGVGFSVIDLTAAMLNLEPLEAAKQLAADYGILIDEQKPNNDEYIQLQSDRRLVQGLENWCKDAEKTLASLWRLMSDDMEQYAPATPADLDSIHPRFVAACHLREYVNYLFETLQDVDFNGKIEFFKELESEVREFDEYHRKCLAYEETVRP